MNDRSTVRYFQLRTDRECWRGAHDPKRETQAMQLSVLTSAYMRADFAELCMPSMWRCCPRKFAHREMVC